MTQIIIPSEERTKKGQQKELYQELDRQKSDARISFGLPFCKRCNKRADSIRMERYTKNGIDYIALIVTCHGQTHVKEIQEFGLLLEETRNFFDDPKMYSNSGKSQYIRIDTPHPVVNK